MQTRSHTNNSLPGVVDCVLCCTQMRWCMDQAGARERIEAEICFSIFLSLFKWDRPVDEII